MGFRTLVESLAAGIVVGSPSECASPPTPLRVLAVIPGDGQGSSFIFVRRQVSSFSDLGVTIQSFFLRSRTSLLKLFQEGLRLRRALAEFNADLVHAHYGTVTSFLCAIAVDRPLVVTFRGSDLNAEPNVNPLRSRIGIFLSRLSALRARSIVCTNSQLRSRLWWGQKKTEVVPSGVNLELFRPIERDKARRLLGWPTAEKVVLFNAGRNPLVKGLSLARGASEITARSFPLFRLVVLDGTCPPENVPVYLSAADCLIVASKSEGSPNIVKEAMACNLPVVSVDVGDVRERLAGDPSSCVVGRDPMAMAEAITEVLRSGKRSAGREKVMALSEQEIARKIARIYWSVIGVEQQAGAERMATKYECRDK